MTQKQQLSESMDNLVVSAQMEGIQITENLKAMYLAILDGEATLESCLASLNAKYQKG